MQNGRTTFEDSLAVSIKERPNNLTLSGIYTNELKTYIHTKIYTTALFIIVQKLDETNVNE